MELVETSKSLVDGLAQGAAGLPALGAHDDPEHRMVVVAAAVVAHRRADVFRYSIQIFDQILGALAAELRVLLHSGV